jgi:hypothetical protein
MLIARSCYLCWLWLSKNEHQKLESRNLILFNLEDVIKLIRPQFPNKTSLTGHKLWIIWLQTDLPGTELASCCCGNYKQLVRASVTSNRLDLRVLLLSHWFSTSVISETEVLFCLCVPSVSSYAHIWFLCNNNLLGVPCPQR